MEQKITQFNNYKKIMHALSHLNGVLYFDAATSAPKGSYISRATTTEYLSGEMFSLLTSPETIDLVNYLLENNDKIDKQTHRECVLVKRELDKLLKMPKEEFVEYQVLLNESSSIWEKAKKTNDYNLFKPYLKKIIEFNIKMAAYIDPKKQPYDALLGQFEYGFSTKDYDPYFKSMQESLVPTILAINEAGQPDSSFLDLSYPIYKQRELSDRVMALLGIDREYCNISESEHPFTTNFSKYDVRITTHYHENMMASSLYSVIHEGGHAIYELNTADEYQYGPLASGTSLGLHESQSRFYENIIGRSREFMTLLLPILKELFPNEFENVNEDMLYRALNIAKPSLIRTEADELTYSMHVLIRYELEKQLIAGTLSVDDAAQAWKDMYKSYLGVNVPDDTTGILQDSHWAGGAFGYFPTYSIGSAYSSQIKNAIEKEFSVNEAIQSGNISKITKWLNENIHKHGSMYDPKEILQLSCKEDFIPQYYFDYLNNKFKALYNL
ncbi:MAG: carboxypeptidase M32 [Christensenellaceae bacterium]|nr:carboxypeptidase M32 [Christensenellaceae bacterium]